MAARTVKIRHDEETRAKIQATQLINRLQNHALGKNDMSATQIRAAEIVLKKTLPDLTAAENKTEVTHRYVADVPAVSESVEKWQQQHSPPTLQ